MDIDLCGPSIPRMFGLHGNEVHQSNEGWQPVYVDDNLGVMSIGFLLGNQDDAVIWRGPRKNGLIKQFLTDVAWGELDYLLIDSIHFFKKFNFYFFIVKHHLEPLTNIYQLLNI